MGAHIHSYLMSEGARGQANFYVESLGGEQISFRSSAMGTYYGEVVDKFGVTWMITKQ
ncbi:hypothetical protein [Paenibacillus germinis]|uniref:hypothetical protein n=1 Tax=Paenibacillus germinis TaxID=2654979 RepID=UPI0014930719|nr:hypothetical protein [Paenibacillus germinis]